MLCNGDFEQPRVTVSNWQIYSSIPCWTSAINEFELTTGREGMTGQAMDLDTYGQAGQYFEQTFNVTEDGEYLFKMDYIANLNVNQPETSKFSVSFNGEEIADITPADMNKHDLSIRVNAKAGQNVLRLTNKSTYATGGAYVDNVGIYKINYK